MTEQAGAEQRQAHVVMDLATRRWKAEKIWQLLDLDARPGPIRLLEVGTGSGGIAHYFGAHPSGRFSVAAVDVVDNRLAFEGFDFSLVTGTDLPFADGSFDVVLSNHVIEHVGDEAEQLKHLAELRRVLRPGGIGYLAVPNRWMLVEPHFRLAFLSWLPRSWRSPYLRLAGKGRFYDCEPLEMRQLERFFERSEVCFHNRVIDALRATLRIERPGSLGDRLVQRLPDGSLRPFLRWIPTHIYTFAHGQH